MRDFYHELNFQDHVNLEHKSIARVCVILIVLLILYLTAWSFGYGGGDLSILIGFFLLVFFLLYQDKGKLKKFGESNEKWNVSVVGSEFSWSSPKQINEKSFSVDISEIVQIQKSYNDRDDNSPYCFYFENGDKANPKINSSINMDELIEVLIERGVTVKKVSCFEKYKT